MKNMIPINHAVMIFKILTACFLFTYTGTAKAQCCTYTLSMHDSYGDGWNGGYLEVYLNHILTGTFSASLFGSVDTFLVCDGDTLQLNYTAGSYENENTYQLFDPNWNLVFSGGPTPQTGNVLTTLGNCFGLAVPGNNPCTAIAIDTGACIIADNTGFLSSGLNAGCGNFQGGDMWFKMLVPPSGNLSFVTDSGTINDTGLAVWTDNTCTNLHSLGCDDDSGIGYFSQLMLSNLTPGQQLYIQIWGYGGGTGTFRFCVNDLGTVNLDSTRLPIIMINTLGQTIPNDVKIHALMDIKYNGPNFITHITDSSNVYSGHIGIEIRGATSAGYPQTPYGIETRKANGNNNNVSLLGMPVDNDWVLISNFNDRSLIRNTLAYKLFGEMGNYSPRTSLCEVLVDSSYQGIYVFGEKIKQGNGRVDIAKLNPGDTIGDQLTGGYILQQNIWNASNSFMSNFSPIDHPGFDVHFLYDYPDYDIINTPQKTYIAAYVDSLEAALYSQNFSSPATGYRKYLDEKSFIDYFLVNELSRNNDGFKKSVFFNKDQFSHGGKLKAGPVWDFDWAWKNLYGCSIFGNLDGSGWAYQINDCPTDNYSCGWYVRLLQDSSFRNELRCTYETYRQTILDTSHIFAYIDSIEDLVQQAQLRHFQKWPILGVSGPAPEVGAVAASYSAELDSLKLWINKRLQWMDANMPGLCTAVSSGPELQNPSQTLNYYPNPSTGIIHFEGSLDGGTPFQMSIYDYTGKLIDQLSIHAGEVRFDYQLHRKGVYFFSITNGDGLVQRGRLIVI